MTNHGQHPVRRKLVVAGDWNTGKTSLAYHFVHGHHPGIFGPSTVENCAINVVVDDKPMELSVWAACSAEEYDRLRPYYTYRNAHVCIITFAIDMPETLEHADKWIQEIQTTCGKDIPVLLVGCKSDLRLQSSESRFISRTEGELVAQAVGACGYQECSSKHNKGVDAVLEAAARAALTETKEKRSFWTWKRLNSGCILG